MAKTGLPATGGDDSAARFGAASGNGHDSRVPGGDDDPDGRFGPRTSGSTMFHVKICGITTAVDALAVAAAGADAVGLNFVPGSPRCLDRDRARAVAAAVPSGVLRVGVFAGASPADMLSLAVANYVTVLNPGRLILGGGVLSNVPALRARVEAGVARFTNANARKSVQVVDAALGDDAGLLGAALLGSAQR